MRKIWLVAATTYRQRVRSGVFLFLAFGLPALMALVAVVTVISMGGGGDDGPLQVGAVDAAGQLAWPGDGAIAQQDASMARYEDAQAAQAAFDAGEIEGYLVIPAGYLADAEPLTFYGRERPGPAQEAALTDLLRRGLQADASADLLARLDAPSRLTYSALEGGRQVAQGLPQVVRFVTPAALAIIFALAIFTGATQLGSAVVREKDQRAMEMVITSIRPRELVAGKVLGMSLLNLTQVAVWVGAGALAVTVAALSAPSAPQISIPWRAVIWGAALGASGYLFFAVIASGLGVIAGDAQQARQLAGFLGFVSLTPLYFMSPIMKQPDGPIAVGLSLFPLTSPTISLMRMVLTEVPSWQLWGALAILLLSLAAGTWAVARIFRAAMLLYGQTLRPAEVVRALRQA
jgi:ABC-2 type transport system permease protein